MTPPQGRHLIIDGYGADAAVLNDLKLIEHILRHAIEAGGVQLLKIALHAFEPLGVTAFALLTESHISIHTWPEHGFFTADLFFCGGDIEAAKGVLIEGLKPGRTEVSDLRRGAKSN